MSMPDFNNDNAPDEVYLSVDMAKKHTIPVTLIPKYTSEAKKQEEIEQAKQNTAKESIRQMDELKLIIIELQAEIEQAREKTRQQCADTFINNLPSDIYDHPAVLSIFNAIRNADKGEGV